MEKAFNFKLDENKGVGNGKDKKDGHKKNNKEKDGVRASREKRACLLYTSPSPRDS